MRRILSLTLSALFILALAAPALASPQQERRVALVIGNSAYRYTARLANTINDARLMGATLKRLGFDVEVLTDLDKAGTDKALRSFGQRCEGARVALLYYSGHGMQVNGVNYLCPVDVRLARGEKDLDFEVVSMNVILRQMEEEKRTNLIFLDACRNNPLAEDLKRSMRSSGRGTDVGRGLAPMDASTGTMISYATRDGSVASDGVGRNSPYTSALASLMETPGLEVGLLLRKVRQKVMADTGEKQVPWDYGSLLGEFYFTPGQEQASLGPGGSPTYTPAPLPKVSAPPKPGSGTVDLSDIDAAAQARAKAEAEQARLDQAARKEWAARLKAMQTDFAKVQGVEKSGKYSPDMKAKAWEKFLAAYTGDNPYTSEDQTLRATARTQQAHWEAEAKRLAKKEPPRVQPAPDPPGNGASSADAKAILQEAKSASKSTDRSEAIRLYTRALESGGLSRADRVKAHNDRGDCYFKMRDYDRALVDFEESLRLDPGYTLALANRGVTYEIKQQYDRAIESFDQALRTDPNYMQAYFKRAHVYNAMGKYDRAIEDYDRYLREKPSDADAFNNRGDCYFKNRNYERAFQDFDQAVRVRPDFALGYSNRALARKMLGQIDLAKADAKRAKELDPQINVPGF